MSRSQTTSTAAAMATAYDPGAVEAGWYARWEEAGLFRADPRSPKPKYSIALPPPNVTGELHMGHAVNAALQDVWARYRRMTGYEVLWLPGTDHAAIATQNVIERQLAQEGTTKEEIGREAFQARVERWYQEVGQTIISQFRELGASLDFSRTRFTMDEGYVRAVRTAFVHYYEKGWLYRGPRIVNWCPRCRSAISDLEVEWREHTDVLYSIRYPVVSPEMPSGEEGERSLVIATVRPETMLADTGVAVHPSDGRYRHLVGEQAVLPLVGRRLPIVADEAVDPDFGTGALKVTPGHDPLDWEIGRRHGLAVVNAMHPDGRMNVPDLPEYDGRPALEAREQVVRDLQAGGYLVDSRPHVHQVGHCDRCGAVLEPMVSEQWWLRMDELARRCQEASAQGKVRWHPARFERTYLDWLAGIRDWCVSRQLWLGHRIPVYTCGNGHVFASVEEPERCRTCQDGLLVQDPDVLDTWFSSALWPFATLGWPADTEDLRAFYPTSLNVTARDIINLWVTRMIFSGLELMGEVPFSDVMINATIQAADGRRMSKSLGTGVDPREIVRRYGADALRAWAAQVAMSSQDVRYDESRIEGFRRFANKLWNATRLVLADLNGVPPSVTEVELGLMDRWVLSRLDRTVAAVTEHIEDYTFTGSVSALYEFAWHDFCDWYLEAAKPRLRAGERAAQAVATHVLDVVLRLLHPFMPFVTEELWHRLPGDRDFLVRMPWPRPAGRQDPAAEATVGRLIALVEEVRRARQVTGAPRRGGRLLLEEEVEPELASTVAELAAVDLVGSLPEPGIVLSQVAGRVAFPAAGEGGSVHRATRQRLERELDRVRARLANPEFTGRAPAQVVERERDRLAELEAALERIGPA
ncbi:MAG TPA: valine--tRNA ligase [Candidatus Dormibacteraeota bacterium]|nr:valine--tRNA ligase [Candidatus Dormibacteraeota bacterium]